MVRTYISSTLKIVNKRDLRPGQLIRGALVQVQ
jgi:hypothetical protein